MFLEEYASLKWFNYLNNVIIESINFYKYNIEIKAKDNSKIFELLLSLGCGKVVDAVDGCSIIFSFSSHLLFVLLNLHSFFESLT